MGIWSQDDNHLVHVMHVEPPPPKKQQQKNKKQKTKDMVGAHDGDKAWKGKRETIQLLTRSISMLSAYHMTLSFCDSLTPLSSLCPVSFCLWPREKVDIVSRYTPHPKPHPDFAECPHSGPGPQGCRLPTCTAPPGLVKGEPLLTPSGLAGVQDSLKPQKTSH